MWLGGVERYWYGEDRGQVEYTVRVVAGKACLGLSLALELHIRQDKLVESDAMIQDVTAVVEIARPGQESVKNQLYENLLYREVVPFRRTNGVYGRVKNWGPP